MTPIQVSWLIETQLHAAPPCLGRGSRDFRLLGPRAWSRPWTVVVFWVLAACLLPRVASSQQPLPGSIQGRVWAEDGTPVRAVLIRAFPSGSQTAATITSVISRSSIRATTRGSSMSSPRRCQSPGAGSPPTVNFTFRGCGVGRVGILPRRTSPIGVVSAGGRQVGLRRPDPGGGAVSGPESQ